MKLFPHRIYHVYNRGNQKQRIFFSNENYLFFLQKVRMYWLPCCDILCYCLMPNHFHFLAKVKPFSETLLEHVNEQSTVKSMQFKGNEISYHEYLIDQFKRLFGSYALAYNNQHARTGTLFQKRFKRILIGDDYKLLYLLAYIHHNPIHHKFCDSFGSWQHDSWNAYLNLEKESLLNREEVLRWFGADVGSARAAFLKHHQDFKEDRKMLEHCLEDD